MKLDYGMKLLRPIVVDLAGLQECFRQQYSKFGNIREQLFHVWRSFHYDENLETIDAYVNRIKQVAVLLNYGEPQIIELLKHHRPFKPQIHPKKRREQNRQNFGNRNRKKSFSIDKDKILDLTIGDNHKTDAHNMDMAVEEEVIDIKIMIIEMTVEIEGDKTLGEASIMTDMTIGIGVGQDKEV